MAADRRFDRRSVLGWAGAGAVGLTAGVGAGLAGERHVDGGSSGDAGSDAGSDAPQSARLVASDHVVSRSPLPQGLADRTPAFGHVLGIDLEESRRRSPAMARAAARRALERLSAVADEAARGRGSDTGAGAAGLDLHPANLQVTIGVGASLLTACDLPQPTGLVPVPAYDTDRLEPGLSGGDLFVQVGAEDPMRLAGAVQQVARALGGETRLRWSRPGFRPTQASADEVHGTPRNLMGHRDGTANPDRDTPLWHATVTTHDPGSWMDGGSYLVVRQIRMDLDAWFSHGVTARDHVIGRDTATGAPLGRHREHAPVDLDLRDADGGLAIGPHAHIRLAGTRNTAGARIFRRGWNYDLGWTDRGVRDAGLIFLAWQGDLSRGFLPIQAALSRGQDALNDVTTHIGSAVFAMPPRGDDAYLGQRILEA